MPDPAYREIAPAPALARWVHCVWMFEAGEPKDAPERIVPDGRPELVIHLGAPFAEVAADGGLAVQPRMLFAGQVTRPLHLRATGSAQVIGVRFKPAGARAFIGASMRETTDRRVAVDFALPEGMSPLEAVQCFVHDRIEALGVEEDEAMRACAERIEASVGQASIEALQAIAGVGRRQLERRFAGAVGIGPALLASIFRFRSVFDLLEHDTSRPWTDAAVAAGYYDQSHFIRDFRRFVGCTPSEFARERAGLAAALVAPPRG